MGGCRSCGPSSAVLGSASDAGFPTTRTATCIAGWSIDGYPPTGVHRSSEMLASSFPAKRTDPSPRLLRLSGTVDDGRCPAGRAHRQGPYEPYEDVVTNRHFRVIGGGAYYG